MVFTSKAIAQTTIVFITSIYDVLENVNLVLHQRNSDAIILYDNLPANASDRVVTFAGDVLFEMKPATSIKREATPGERIDLRISGQPEGPHTQDDKAYKTFLIFSLTRQVLSSPVELTMTADLINNNEQEKTDKSRRLPWNDLINNYSQKIQQKSTITLYHIEMQKFLLKKTATCNDMKFQRSRIVCNALDTRDQAKHVVAVVVCCRASPKRSRNRQSNV